MKKFLLIVSALLLVLVVNQSFSQTLFFCDSVDKEGNAITPATSFNISPKGGYLYFLVDLGFEVGTDEVYYEIYRVDTKGKEIYDRTIYKEVDPKAKKFSHQVMFNSPGKYNIYVYKGDGIYLTSNSLRINLK
ncbi:MAG: hypothetical protein N3F03_02310 [Ignavibacteria bacterium]|nr:hypothetical protein [Ignavibacteria bacterium]